MLDTLPAIVNKPDAKPLMIDKGHIEYKDVTFHYGAETVAVNKVLNAAGFTYVAAFLTSLAYALWYILPLLLGGRRSD